MSKEFQVLISRALAAKEVNSCMGRVVAAPTAGASGILPGIMVTLQELHDLSDCKIMEGLLVGAGIALIMERERQLLELLADAKQRQVVQLPWEQVPLFIVLVEISTKFLML